MTPEELFNYADKYARKRERQGWGTKYPTMREAAKRFRVTLDEVEDAAGCDIEDGYLGIAVAVGIPGVGISDINPRGAWLVEAYK